MSRLDAAVSGAIVLARTSKAAARLTSQFAGHEVTKIYWALVSGRVDPPSGSCVDWIVKDEQLGRMVVTSAGASAAREARLNYQSLPAWRQLADQAPRARLLEIELLTGRKHQIRVQLAARGWPILGDRKYGSRQPWPAGVALHARRLAFEHPVRHEPVEIEAPLPSAWPALERPGKRNA
jgi:23S rRNA pseudouridine1911/1915/1917 synthase